MHYSPSSFARRQVHGIVRRSSTFNTGRITHIYKDRHETGVRIFLHYGKTQGFTVVVFVVVVVVRFAFHFFF